MINAIIFPLFWEGGGEGGIPPLGPRFSVFQVAGGMR